MIFKDWFLLGKTLSAGDWPYLFKENVIEFSWWPKPPFLWLEPFYQITAKIFTEYLGLSWELTERLVWFWPFLILSFFSSQYFAKIFFKERIFRFLTSLIYLLNTYILMIVGGGQMGVAMAHALTPFVLGKFFLCHFCHACRQAGESHVRRGESRNLYRFRIFASWRTGMTMESIIFGLIIALQLMFDPRIAIITLFACSLYLLFIPIQDRSLKSDPGSVNVVNLLVSIFLAFSFNLFWILPVFKYGLPSLENFEAAFTGAIMAKYLSFASFSNTISLLHPNWPENIFGKVYFMRPEFLVVPILAFSSLLFLKNPKSSKNALISYFSFLALIGSFLAKGANPPFGGVYLWLFENVPGFFIFRDPTKFYLLVCLSYSILIPYSLSSFATWINTKLKRKGKSQNNETILSFAFLVYWLFLIKPAALGELGGTFKGSVVPEEYIRLKNFLVKQDDYFVTFWLPQKQRFGFSSQNHPAIDYQELLPKEELINQEVKYVIIPFDSKGEIFLKDRKYSEKERERVVEELGKVRWLKESKDWGRLTVFEVKAKE